MPQSMFCQVKIRSYVIIDDIYSDLIHEDNRQMVTLSLSLLFNYSNTLRYSSISFTFLLSLVQACCNMCVYVCV